MNPRPRILNGALAVVAVWSVACGEFDPEAHLTISQGVYGMTTSQDDVCSSSCDREPTSMTLLISVMPDEVQVASVTSSEDGFYEVELETGDYQICTAFGRCTEFSVDVGEVVRRDYEMSVGPGW